jgi:glycosyltransferase involved in cell wall biosynthesis
VAELIQAGVEAHLTIIGSGEHLSELESLCGSSNVVSAVSFAGSQSAEAVRKHLQAAHVFVSASLDEAIGVSIMEALSMGVPVVATAVGGVPELIRDGTDGLLVPPRSPSRIADAVLRISEDSELAGSLSSAGPKRVLDRFTSDRSAKALVHSILSAVRPTH